MALINRRAFLAQSARVAGGGLAAFGALQWVACERGAPVAATVGYGPLQKAGSDLALPAGFQYRVFGVEGTEMSDGRPTPPLHDGMAAFPLHNGNIRLIRNHEVGIEPGAAFGEPARAYDPLAGGGTTSLEINPVTREIVRDFASLSGTTRNCAGGPTPWQSWLTCEEYFGDQRQGYQKRHGYVFDVPVSAEQDVPAIPLRALGRFIHEAVAVDPATGIVYETEDQREAGFYRFVPDGPYRRGERPNLTNGRLQMLALRDRSQYDAATGQSAGVVLPVHWVNIPDPDPTGDSVEVNAVFQQGWERGAARFTRIEGCWYEDGAIYLRAPTGAMRSRAKSGATARRRTAETSRWCSSPPGPEVLKRPDTICTTPKGVLVLCEDAAGSCFLRGLTRGGEIFDFAQNIANESELAGATFSPDGQTLFVNIQETGQTLAIWGPWDAGPF